MDSRHVRYSNSSDEIGLLLTPEYEDIALDLIPTDKSSRKRATTLYDSDRPEDDFPRWIPSERPTSAGQRLFSRALVCLVSLIILSSIGRALWSLLARPTLQIRSDFIVSNIASKSGSPSRVSFQWTLREQYIAKANRTFITINHKTPGPMIEAFEDDIIAVHVRNDMSIPTSIHWHGMAQSHSNAQDGVPFITQNAILPGDNYIYTFTAESAGTFWWHAHAGTSRLDGLYGALIIHPRDDLMKTLQIPGSDITDLVVLAGDWYTQDTATLVSQYLTPENRALQEPLPSSIMINGIISQDAASATFPLPRLERQTRFWRLRIINVGAMADIKVDAPARVKYFTLIEADASLTMPVEIDSLTIAPGQRYSFLLDTKNLVKDDTIEIGVSLVLDSHLHAPQVAGSYVHAHHHHRSINESHALRRPLHDGLLHPPIKQFKFSKNESVAVVVPAMHVVSLGMIQNHGVTRSSINGQAFTVPNHTLIHAYLEHSGRGWSNKYGADVLTFSMAQGESVLLLFRSDGGGSHPIHIHGHKMQILATDTFHYSPVTGDRTSRPFDESSISSILRGSMDGAPLERVIMRDTVNVAKDGWTLVRVIGGGKGLWSMHCHSAWHEMSGMSMILEIL